MASDLEVKPIGLSDLPDDILIYIWRHLGPLDLVSLTRQDVRCGRLAKSPELWRRICQQRWPNCKMEEAYEGDMYLMYRTRLGYPPGFLVSVDNVLGLQQGSAPSFHIINRLMKSVFSIGLEVCKLPDLRQTREYKKYAETVLACLSSRPEAFVAFVEQARSTLEEFDMWQAAFVGWPETPWKRSAVAFLLEVMGRSEPWRYASLREALEARLLLLDDTIRSVEDEAESLAVKVPCGTPAPTGGTSCMVGALQPSASADPAKHHS